MHDAKKVYDLAVIGGGIAGAGVARDAAQRGLSVILFEKKSLGSGASSKSSRLIHGGIRYLELAWENLRRLRLKSALINFRFVLSSLRETAALARIAPKIVTPIRLFVPVYRGRARRPAAVFFGTRFYGCLSRLAGNSGRPAVYKNARAASDALPLLNPDSLAGAVEIDDYTTDDLALVHAVAESARTNGALILENCAVTSWEKKDGIFYLWTRGAVECSYTARAVVNATGAWIDRVRGAAQDHYVYPVGGSHIELPAFLGHSAILEASDGRVFFVIEKNGRARVGTTEWPHEDPDHVNVPDADIEYLLESLKRYFPSQPWSRADVLSSDAGLRPLAVNGGTSSATRISREHRIRTDADGVWHLAGVKLTDHRRAAEKITDRVMKQLGRKDPGCRTAMTPL